MANADYRVGQCAEVASRRLFSATHNNHPPEPGIAASGSIFEGGFSATVSIRALMRRLPILLSLAQGISPTASSVVHDFHPALSPPAWSASVPHCARAALFPPRRYQTALQVVPSIIRSSVRTWDHLQQALTKLIIIMIITLRHLSSEPAVHQGLEEYSVEGSRPTPYHTASRQYPRS